MYDQYLSFNENNSSLNICDENFNIIETFALGECIIDFLEKDYTQYALFYDDIESVLRSNPGSSNRFEDIIIPGELEKEVVDNFYAKYPKLKDFIYKEKEDFYEYIYGKQSDNEKSELLELINLANTTEDKELFYSLTKEGNVNRMVSDIIYNRAEFNALTWKFIFDSDCPNEYIDNIEDIRSSPFVQLAYDEMSDDGATKYETAFQYLKETYWIPFLFCFDVEYNPLLNSLTALQRFYLYTKTHSNSRFNYEFTNTSFSVISNSKDPSTEFSKLDENTIASIKNQNIEQVQLFDTVNINNMLYIEFNKMLNLNIKVMKCKNCGKYFILKGGYNTKFCNRVPEGEKYTCQKIAALKKQKEKLDNNKILKEYQKAYKRKYAQVSNKKLDQEKFRLWVEEATLKRDIASEQYNNNSDDQIVQEFKKYLENK